MAGRHAAYEVDSHGCRRPSASDALARLIGAVDPEAINRWDAVNAAVEAADEDTVRHALRRLLALHLHNLRDTEPQVAMRNVRVGDYVRLHGCTCYVEAVAGSEKRCIGLRVRHYEPGGYRDYFAYHRGVRIPLVARNREESDESTADPSGR